MPLYVARSLVTLVSGTFSEVAKDSRDAGSVHLASSRTRNMPTPKNLL